MDHHNHHYNEVTQHVSNNTRYDNYYFLRTFLQWFDAWLNDSNGNWPVYMYLYITESNNTGRAKKVIH